MDEKFTEKLEAWLAAPREEQNVMEGAQMLLQLRGSRFLYQNILRKPEKMHDKLVYELQKHLKLRKQGKTIRDIDIMTVKVMGQVQTTLAQPQAAPSAPKEGAKYRGKRADHDSLPAEIQALYDKNAKLYAELQVAFEDCKKLGDGFAPERKECVEDMARMDAEIAENWFQYDHWTPTVPAAEGENAPEEGKEESAGALTAEEVSAARKYISDNRKKLMELLDAETPNEDEIAALKENIQQRITALCTDGKGFRPDYQAALEGMGFIFAADKAE